mgnify:CR=1 FL=1
MQARDAGRRAADTIVRLKAAAAAGSGGGAAANGGGAQQGAAPPAGKQEDGAGGGPSAAAVAATDPDLVGLSTTEQEIKSLRGELAEVKAALKKVDHEGQAVGGRTGPASDPSQLERTRVPAHLC